MHRFIFNYILLTWHNDDDDDAAAADALYFIKFQSTVDMDSVAIPLTTWYRMETVFHGPLNESWIVNETVRRVSEREREALWWIVQYPYQRLQLYIATSQNRFRGLWIIYGYFHSGNLVAIEYCVYCVGQQQ